VSDEPEFDGRVPEPLSDLGFFASDGSVREPAQPLGGLDDASVALVPAQQFSSRREARNAAMTSSRGSKRAPKSTSVAKTGPAVRTTKLSRRDQAAIKKLAATPAIAPARITPATGKQKRQNPIKVIFVLLVISGFVGGVALPAAATGSPLNTAAGITTSYKHSQTVKVSATIESSKVSRDSVSATSEAELRAEQINARLLADSPGVRQAGDDYPWRLAGNTLSPLGYYYRQCVDFVAWRLNRDQGVTSAPWKWVWSNLTPNGGDASQWKSAWLAHKWTVSTTPIVGSVAWFVGDHVAYVHSISGSNVTIEEYNGEASRSYAMRTIPISSVADFLYPPH
jgi:surface antigen